MILPHVGMTAQKVK